MGNFRKVFCVLAVACAMGSAQAAFAADANQRVIEESLVYKDPTVSKADQWVVGGAVEGWYINGKYNIYSNGNKIADGTIHFTQPGGDLYFGKGPLTLMVSYRSGKGTLDLNWYGGATNSTNSIHQKDTEIALRWLIPGLSNKHGAIYALAGYSMTDYTEDDTIIGGGTWTSTGTKFQHVKTRYTAPMFGLGVILPVNAKLGFRVDGRLKAYSAKQTYANAEYTGSGLGGDFTVTMYYNIYRGINLQLGGKITQLNGGKTIGTTNRNGVFAMLGYTFK